MKYTFFVGLVLLGFHFQTHAEGMQMNRACRIMFAVDSKYVAPVERIRSELQSFTESGLAELEYLYTRLSVAQLKKDLNWAVSNIAETNNDILDVGAYLRSERFRFSSRVEKATYEKLMGSLKSLLLKQGMSPEFVDGAFEKRFMVVEELKEQGARPTVNRPIGFIVDEVKKLAKKSAAPKRIGFMRVPVEQTAYGRKSGAVTEKDDKATKQTGIGFIKIEAEPEEAAPRSLPSIGFTQSEAPVDVGYLVSLSFNFSTAQFEVRSGQNQIGFVLEK